MKHASFGLLIVGLVILLAGGLVAQDKVVVTSTAEVILANCTPEEAQEYALKKARLDAIEKVCGVTLQAGSFVRDSVLQGDFIHAVSYGHILSEDIVAWEYDVVQKSPKQPPAFSYRVTLRTAVLKEKGTPDPYYRVRVRLNKIVYQSGDEMVIYVRTTKPGYITILNFTADDRVILLFPNSLRRDNQIAAGTEYQIPSDADREGVLKLQVSTLPGQKKNTEHIKVIATSKPINLIEGISLEGQYGVMGTVQLAVTEIARLISAIPVRERAEDTATYQIVSSE
ncbi:MAG: DUF4384 domain-containing protein [Deltaproteobacteria bacterium]|nr:DUF4384 domain-containing protein [Deltaproteobacteria bacterium]